MTGLLLDTHVVLWWLEDAETLEDDLKRAIDEQYGIFVSPVTIWEIAQKETLGKLRTKEDVPARIMQGRFQELVVRHEHARVAGTLPLHHRDPFDRMLIAQAQCENLTLVTHDGAIKRYDVDVLSV